VVGTTVMVIYIKCLTATCMALRAYITSQLTSSVPSDRRTFMSNINQHPEFCLKSSSNRNTQIFNAHHHHRHRQQQQQNLNEKGKTKNPNKNQGQKMRMEEPSNEKRKI
jgi:hypothetical protein